MEGGGTWTSIVNTCMTSISKSISLECSVVSQKCDRKPLPIALTSTLVQVSKREREQRSYFEVRECHSDSSPSLLPLQGGPIMHYVPEMWGTDCTPTSWKRHEHRIKREPKRRDVECIVQYHTARKSWSQDSKYLYNFCWILKSPNFASPLDIYFPCEGWERVMNPISS